MNTLSLRTAARRAAVLFAAVALALSACTPRDRSAAQDEPAAPPEYVFDVDPDLLGATLLLDGVDLTLQPPHGWEPVDELTRSVVEARIRGAGAGGPIAGSLIELLVESVTGSALTIISLDGKLSPREIGSALGQAAGAEEAVFRHAGLEIVQIRTVSDQTLTFSLLTRTPDANLVLLQYAVARAAGPRTIRAVESSIGSLRTSQE